jgi:hypothetical protein
MDIWSSSIAAGWPEVTAQQGARDALDMAPVTRVHPSLLLAGGARVPYVVRDGS